MTDMKKRRAPGWVPDLSSFGARLALVRQQMGWGNVKQAADLCGIPTETWRTWERDGMQPRQLVNACMKIAGVTGVDYRWLALGPDLRAESAEQVPAATTLGYFPTGEHVVAVGMPDRPLTRAQPRSMVRARPIDSRRVSTLEHR